MLKVIFALFFLLLPISSYSNTIDCEIKRGQDTTCIPENMQSISFTPNLNKYNKQIIRGRAHFGQPGCKFGAASGLYSDKTKTLKLRQCLRQDCNVAYSCKYTDGHSASLKKKSDTYQNETSKEIIFWEGTVNGEPLKITDKGVYRDGKFKKVRQLRKKDLCIFGNNTFPYAQRAGGNPSKYYIKEWLTIIYQKEIEYLPYCYSLRRNYDNKNEFKLKTYEKPTTGQTQMTSVDFSKFVSEDVDSYHDTDSSAELTVSPQSDWFGVSVEGQTTSPQITSSTSPSPSTVPTAELTATQREADELRKKLAALEAVQQQEQQIITNDTRAPLIDQLTANTSGKQGIISGRARDDSGIAEITIDGRIIQVQSDGSFEYQTFVPSNGINLRIVATDLSGLSSEKFIALERSASSQTASITFDRLNPLDKKVRRNDNAIALVVGIANYENTPAKAIYADSDALMFKDYASEKLGIPENRIKTMVNDKADERELLLSVKSWLARSVRQDQTDVYIFFAGHGLASEDGKRMYLLPYDGAPELLDDTAIMRNRLFADIASSGPRSVTVFFDTCYSGTTRGPDMLIASRPIAIRAKGSSIPDGFTVFTAAGGDQTAKPLKEAKHGMFSYFLMKGMEGDADSNRDNQITAAELHEYVEQNVVQQSGGSQVPELQGDADRVLVSFQ